MIDIYKAIKHLLAEFKEILLDGLLLIRGIQNIFFLVIFLFNLEN